MLVLECGVSKMTLAERLRRLQDPGCRPQRFRSMPPANSTSRAKPGPTLLSHCAALLFDDEQHMCRAHASTRAYEAALPAGLGSVPLQLLGELAREAAAPAAQAAEVQLCGNVQQLVPVNGGLIALSAAGLAFSEISAALLYLKAPARHEVSKHSAAHLTTLLAP